ncbi:MAG: error-prone DNA polymerase [Myxococcales bacterium]|jgi:error-prone DNA polymerase
MYAELTCRTNYTFLTGASHPEELVERARALGLSALAITDRDGLYGIVKAHLAAKEQGLKLLVGTELTFADAPPLTLIARDLEGYRNLCRLITRGRTARPKGESLLPLSALEGHAGGLFAILRRPHLATATRLRELFGARLYLGLQRTLSAGDERRVQEQLRLSRELGVAPVAVNDVHTHDRARQPLQDVLVCIREKTTLDEAGRRLFGNAERTLKSPREMVELFADVPEAVDNTLAIAEACTFSLDQIAYQFPEEDIPAGHTPITWLRELTYRGALGRYGEQVPEDARRQIEHELQLIEELGYPGYFLTLHSIVEFARSRDILCQGRGSAANSVVCYCLGITAIDPVRMRLLFERFISRERNEPPDIDVDFEHERREEVLQHIYVKYGRDRAAMVCEVITYRGRSALRDVGKALGLSLDQVDRLATSISRWGESVQIESLAELGLDPTDRTLLLTLELAGQIEGFPRHLSIHSGGFAITKGPIYDLVPVENAAMEGRTVVQWDKDDVAAAGILKVDLLSLGMLSAVAKALATVRETEGKQLTLASIPAEDPATYAMLQDADTVGVFQIESRAQMNMLPRLKPKTFYDLVVEVAIIRPGPIIGQMVHPYLRRRDGIEPVTYPHPVFEPILGRTLGVTLFQEQVMRLAVAAAGFTLGEADALRRAMGHKRSYEKLMQLKERFIVGLGRLGLTREQGEAVFKQFEGFAHYGFPESHAASFALIAYASSWLKRHHPAAFVCGLLNSQPMGFYAPHTLIEDARRHGVPALPVDVQHSSYDCTLERIEGPGYWPPGGPPPHAPKEQPFALRLGLRMVRGLREQAARKIVAARGDGAFRSLYDLWRRTHLSHADLARLAVADALASLLPEGSSRRQALWHVHALPVDEGDLFARVSPPAEEPPRLPAMTASEQVFADYRATGASLNAHPMELMRASLTQAWILASRQVAKMRAGAQVRVAGMAIVRQRPETAKGMFFVTLEDELGFINVVATPDVFAEYRRVARTALFLLVKGRIERSGKVVHVKAQSFEELRLGEELPVHTRDFH